MEFGKLLVYDANTHEIYRYSRQNYHIIQESPPKSQTYTQKAAQVGSLLYTEKPNEVIAY